MVVYYDTINDPARRKAELWMQASYDFGVTWTAPLQIATALTDETVAGAQLNFQYGDYIGLTGHAGRFFACWTDRRSGGTEEIWGAPLFAPELATAIPNNGKFANTCVGSFADELLTIVNNGPNLLSVSNITSSSPDFAPPGVLAYPLNISAGGSLNVVLRFQPTSFGSKSATITIFSNDPAGPQTISVFGNALPGKLAVTGSTCFGGVKACCCAERAISICNVGDCNLLVSSVAFKRKSAHWKLINNPFPATLRPGACLCVVIRYKATERYARSCELVITSDDPVTPVKTLDVLAHTIWDDCGCKHCCEDCKKGCCQKHHTECCSEHAHVDCCEDDEDED